MQQNSAIPRPASEPANRLPARFGSFARTVVGLSAALHAYIGLRLLPALPIGRFGLAVGIALLALSASLLPLGMFARFVYRNERTVDRLTWAGSLAMGLFSTVLVLTFLRDVALIFVARPEFATATAMAVPALALLITAIGFVNARRVPHVVDVAIPLERLPPELVGFTIVQISDIHVGSTIKGDYVRAVVARVNELAADLVAITGDLVDGSVERLAQHVAPLAGLVSRHGTHVVTGNHEYYSGATQWIGEFRRLGMHVLINQHRLIEHDGAMLTIAGVTDYSAHDFDPDQRSDPLRAAAGSPDGSPRILLAHQPRSASAAAAAGFDLQLSGHTHGGQFWPWNHLVRVQQPYIAGLHRLDRLWIYTSRGTGYWGPPKRFGAPAEITRLHLVSAQG